MSMDFNEENISKEYDLIKLINQQIGSLSTAMSSIEITSSLQSAGIFNDCLIKINNFLNNSSGGISLGDLELRVKEIRDILIENNAEMSVLFSELDNFNFSDFGNYQDFDDHITTGMIYNQCEAQYYNIPYGGTGGNLATNGCGFFSVLSIITAKTGHIFSYDEIVEIANWAMDRESGRSALSNEQKMELIAEHLSDSFGYTFSRKSSDLVNEVLISGGAAIALTNYSSHFIPITGIMENGNYVINDTDGSVYYGDYKTKVDVTGFNVENGDIVIQKKWVNGVPEGELWYFEFDDNNNNNYTYTYTGNGLNTLGNILDNTEFNFSEEYLNDNKLELEENLDGSDSVFAEDSELETTPMVSEESIFLQPEPENMPMVPEEPIISQPEIEIIPTVPEESVVP